MKWLFNLIAGIALMVGGAACSFAWNANADIEVSKAQTAEVFRILGELRADILEIRSDVKTLLRETR